MKKYIALLSIGLFLINPLLGNTALPEESNEDNTLKSPLHVAGKRLAKGVWSLGGTLSAKSNNYSDIDLLIVDVDNYNQRAFDLRLEGSYFIKENLSTGLGLQFGEDKTDLTASLLNNSYNREIRNFNRSYGALGFIKNHIPIFSSHTFFITNQTELYYVYKSGPAETYIGSILERKYSEKHSFGIGIRPGILIFFTEGFAFDMNMGLLGFSHSQQDVSYEYPPNNLPPENERKENSRNNSTGLTFKFDILKVGFGFSYYF